MYRINFKKILMYFNIILIKDIVTMQFEFKNKMV